MPTCVRCAAELSPPYQFCARCGAPQGAMQGTPAAYPYPVYYPPPKKNNTLLIVVIILVVVLVAVPVMAAILYIMVSGLLTGPGPTKPIVVFTTATVSSGIARFTVAGASSGVASSSYRWTMQMDYSVPPSPQILGANVTATVNGLECWVTYRDISLTGTLKPGDEFQVSSAGGLPAGHTWTFILLWAADGSVISTVEWQT